MKKAKVWGPVVHTAFLSVFTGSLEKQNKLQSRDIKQEVTAKGQRN
jgi:hypothetical protein